ncbi:MAG: hypothetical protein NVSMB1_04490 [Polyangiales bacterium]
MTAAPIIKPSHPVQGFASALVGRGSVLKLAAVCMVMSPLACSVNAKKDGPTALGSRDHDAASVEDVGSISEGGFDLGTFEVSSEVGDPGSDCTEENKQIYVVTQEKELYRFSPAKLDISKIGNLTCNSFGATPFSMAVDRKGVAWILYSDGHIFKVSTKDASCSPTSFMHDQLGYATFGMAFVADSAGSTTETLFVADYLGKGLAKIDTSSLILSTVGPYVGTTGAAELTGTGSARVFGFFNHNPIDIAELNKGTGALMTIRSVPGVAIGSGWAFAHWGGDFWLFTSPSGSSQVTQYNLTTGASKVVKSGLGFVIVGAGVSTCAPLTLPK